MSCSAIQPSVSGPGPVAAQPHLQEPVAAQRAGLDQPPHRLAVAVERAELDVAGVGVRVEVDHRDPAEAEVPGDAGGVGQGDRVVAAEHQRDGAGGRDGVHRLLERAAARARSRPAASRRRRRRRRGRPGARRPAAPGAAASRPAAGSRSAGSPAARTGCPAGARCRRRTAPRRRPRRPRRAPSASSRSTGSTPRKVMSGPNWAPYRVMGCSYQSCEPSGARYGFRVERHDRHGFACVVDSRHDAGDSCTVTARAPRTPIPCRAT